MWTAVDETICLKKITCKGEAEKKVGPSYYVHRRIILTRFSYSHFILLGNNTAIIHKHATNYFPGKWPTWRTVLFYVFIYIFNSLHVSSTSRSSSGETSCVNTTSGNCQSVSVAVSCAGPKGLAHDTATDSYQRLYWHNLSLLMMSTMCSKHVESEKYK
jgi:hypothetical protein